MQVLQPTPAATSEEVPYPIKGIRFKNGKWVYRIKPPGADTPAVPYEALLGDYCNFMKAKINLPTCVDDRGRRTTCTCLHFLWVHEDKERLLCHCANAILQNYAALQSNTAKDAYLLDMKRYSVSHHQENTGSSSEPTWILPQNPIVNGIN